MSAPAAPTKIFGIQVGVDPKIILGSLIALVVLVYWFSSRSDDAPQTASTTAVRPTIASAAPPASIRRPVQRREARAKDNGVLRVRPVDATRGDVDPTLRLDLLARVRAVGPAENVRNLFEVGAAPAAVAVIAKQLKGPLIVPHPQPGGGLPMSGLPVQPGVNIPLKFYGFSRPSGKGQPSRGLFLDGDNVLVAREGDVLKSRYLVVELSANTARLEDTQLKKGQTLTVVPEAQQP